MNNFKNFTPKRSFHPMYLAEIVFINCGYREGFYVYKDRERGNGRTINIDEVKREIEEGKRVIIYSEEGFIEYKNFLGGLE